jgi:hypothetical protein
MFPVHPNLMFSSLWFTFIDYFLKICLHISHIHFHFLFSIFQFLAFHLEVVTLSHCFKYWFHLLCCCLFHARNTFFLAPSFHFILCISNFVFKLVIFILNFVYFGLEQHCLSLFLYCFLPLIFFFIQIFIQAYCCKNYWI